MNPPKTYVVQNKYASMYHQDDLAEASSPLIKLNRHLTTNPSQNHIAPPTASEEYNFRTRNSLVHAQSLTGLLNDGRQQEFVKNTPGTNAKSLSNVMSSQ
jgi:hypothetical protein